MKLYKTTIGPVVEHDGKLVRLSDDFDSIINASDIEDNLLAAVRKGTQIAELVDLLAPIGNQEVWAAGVTYARSREARMEEAQETGGEDIYARVYDAPRPELFFKAASWRVVGPNGPVRIRRDATWNVPEPELALVIHPSGRIIGYTIGNDMSSRDIEGENPLYLPQAKIYDGACAIGPAIWITSEKPPMDTRIQLTIERADQVVFAGETNIGRIKRTFGELVSYLYGETSFPQGCVLLTGTDLVPPSSFTLHRGDRIEITIDPIGTLTNIVE